MEKSKLEKAVDFLLGNDAQEEVIEKNEEKEVIEKEIEEKEVEENKEEEVEENGEEEINEFDPEIHDVVFENGKPKIVKKVVEQVDVNALEKEAELQAYKVALKRGIKDPEKIRDLTGLFLKVLKGEVGDLENIVDIFGSEETGNDEGKIISKKENKPGRRRVKIN